MRVRKYGWVFAGLLGLAAPIASATILTYNVALSGPAESPPNQSAGTGSATITFDVDLTNFLLPQTMRVQLTFSGLTGATTASHIHCCTAAPLTGTAGVATQVPTFALLPLGVTSGSMDQTLDLKVASSWNPAFVSAHGGTTAGAETDFLAGIAAGKAYLNVHTNVFPGGEIRGFLVPEPASLALLGLGLATLALSRRKRA